ncbi:MAG: benzoate-CoA ligase family protein [Thermoanaerobaculia bacterium]
MASSPPRFVPPEPFNIADYFLGQRLREGRGDRVALRLDGDRLTYRHVACLANRFAGALRRRGVRPDDRVMIALPDGPEFVAALFGTLQLGAVVVMVNPGFQIEDLGGLYAYTRCRCVVVDEAVASVFCDAVVHGPSKPPTGDYLAQVIIVAAGSWREDLTDDGDDELDCFPTHPDDPALWLFSGGTTGRPKAVVQAHRSFANTTELYAKHTLGYREDDVTLSVPKLYFGYATSSNLFFPFSVGASAVLFPEHPTAEVIFDKIARHRPTILINVPTLINRMVSHPSAPEQDLSSLRFATSAGEALPVPLYERWKELFGVELLDGLGTAEMWHIFVTNRPGDVRPGTLGRVVEGFELEVCDDEGRELPAGEVGRLWVRGDSRAICYWQNIEKTAAAFRGEWFVGGDLVRRDADGYVTYCGRADDVLKVAGKWLVPQEVESCLMKHPAVKECAVVGVENEEGLMKPYAFVLPSREAPDLEQELREFALERLDAYKHPRRVIVLDEFPRTHLGKIDRGKLKTMV